MEIEKKEMSCRFLIDKRKKHANFVLSFLPFSNGNICIIVDIVINFQNGHSDDTDDLIY